MNDSMTGSIVLVSALFPSNAETISGNPSWPVSRPMVICGSSRRSLENPRLAEPVALVGLEVQRGHVVEDQAGRAEPGVRGAGRGQLLPPRLLRIGGQAPLERRIRRRREPGLLQHPQAVELAGRLDDPRQHQLTEHLIPARWPGRSPAPGSARSRASSRCPIREEVIGSGPPAAAGIQAQVKLALPGRQPLPRRGLQQLQLRVIVRRADVLDLPRPPPRGVHDLHRRRARRRLHRPHIRHPATLRPRISAQIQLPRTENLQVTAVAPTEEPMIVSQLRTRKALTNGNNGCASP